VSGWDAQAVVAGHYSTPPRWQLDNTLNVLDVELGPEQSQIYYDNRRILQVTGGWRAGKSFVTALHLWARVLQGRLWWLIGPTYDGARAEYNYLVDLATRAGLLESATRRQGDSNTIRLNLEYEGEQITITTKSAAHPEQLGSEAPDGVYMCEAAQHPVEAYFTLIGRTAERRGLLFMSGTLEGAVGWYAEFHTDHLNGYGDLYDEEGATVSLPSWSNRAIYPLGFDDPEIQRQFRLMPKDLFDEKYAGIRTKPSNRVFREFSEARNCGTPPWGPGVDPNRPVEIWIDPGIAHAHAVLAVQFAGRTAWGVDLVYETGLECQSVINICRQRPWWPLIEYWVIDQASTQRGATGTSYYDIWEYNLRRNGQAIPRGMTKIALLAGYQRHRQALLADVGEPQIRFLARFCGPLLGEYSKHVYRTNVRGEIKSEIPIDLNNDAIKCVTYGLWDHWGAIQADEEAAPSVKVSYGRV
jgi:hypothetical protein